MFDTRRNLRTRRVPFTALVLIFAGLLFPSDQEKVAAVQVVQMAVPAAQPAQPTPPGTENQFTEAITLPIDRQITKRLEVAESDYMKFERWTDACRLLQSVLDNKEDVFVQAKRSSADKNEKVRWISAKAQANTLLGRMPAKGLEFYELQYGSQARALLDDAKKKSDMHLLADVRKRYFHTTAGAEATDLLGTYYLDRGEKLMAALCYEPLVQRAAADQLSPLTLFKAVLAFRRAGDQAYKPLADQGWKLLLTKIRAGGLRIEDDTVSVEQLEQELARVVVHDSDVRSSWLMFRGNMSRSGMGHGTAPFLDEPTWQRPAFDKGTSSQTKNWIKQARDKAHDRPDVVLPAFFPITVGDKLLYRSYRAVHCINLKTGNQLWESTALKGSLDNLAGESNWKTQADALFHTYLDGNNPGLFFENSMVGTLSSDNVRVYVVDDVAIPPYPNADMQPWGWNGQQQVSGPLQELSKHSRLIAFDMAQEGKEIWERGESPLDTTELVDSYFLGPPLPVGGLLYVLTEKAGELRLVCLEPQKGEIVWTQTLATARDKLSQDISRRVQAVHLAYGEGILVCPTNAGAVLGVDVLGRSLVWAYPYREKSAAPDPNQQQFRGRFRGGMVMMNGEMQMNEKLLGDWRMSAPVIEGGRVVFTAPDGNALHCVNLRDGGFLWSADRRDDLYLAGVFGEKVVLVGKNTCRALSLADGKKKLWEVTTGSPTGQGVASEGYYYLPVKHGTGTQTVGEVCKINLERGIVEGRTPAPQGEIPGNLVFHEGDVISQNEMGITDYLQVDYKVAQMTRLLEKNPRDPVALTERGELRLHSGDLAGAVADLRQAMAYGPSTALTPKTRTKLYVTLKEMMQRDFDKGEQYLTEYRNLCNVPVPPDAGEKERHDLAEEQKTRQAGYYCLLAQGRERQGRLLDAFQAYLDFGALSQANELLPLANEPTVKVQPAVWAEGRIGALVAKATPDQRKALEAEIVKRWQLVKGGTDLGALRSFVAAYGSLFAVGREARLLLAEKLIRENAFLDAEMHLYDLRRQQDDPQMSARALEALARLMTRRGLLEDAVAFYHILGTEFAKVVVRDGKTGADFLRDLATDKRFLPYLDELGSAFETEKIRVMEISGASYAASAVYPVEAKNELVPFLKRHGLVWVFVHPNNMNAFQLKMIDRDTDQEVWNVTAPASPITGVMRYPYFSKGHLVVLYLGHLICGLDPVNKRKLWERDLYDSYSSDGKGGQLSFEADYTLRLNSSAGMVEKLGKIGPVTAAYVCIRTKDALLALDPVSGDTLWTKTELSPDTQIFGDDDYVYLVDVRSDRSIATGKAIRGRDGISLEVRDFAKEYQHRARIVGGRLLVSENDPTGGLTLRLYDVASGKDMWKKITAPNGFVLRSEDPDLAAVVEPDGKVTVINLVTLKEVLHAQVSTAHLQGVREGLLLRDDRQYYVVLNRPGGNSGPFLNVTFLRTDMVNGTVYAFDPAKGKTNWIAGVNNQMIILERFEELPILLFSSRNNRDANQNGIQNLATTLSIDKRTGKRLYSNEPRDDYLPAPQGQFHALRIDRRNGVIDLIAPNMRLRHYVGQPPSQPQVSASGPTTIPASQAVDASGRIRPVLTARKTDRLLSAPPPVPVPRRE